MRKKNHIEMNIIEVGDSFSVEVDCNVDITNAQRFLLVDALLHSLDIDVDWENEESFRKFAYAMFVVSSQGKRKSMKVTSDILDMLKILGGEMQCE